LANLTEGPKFVEFLFLFPSELVCLFRDGELMASIMLYSTEDPKFVYLFTYAQTANLILEKKLKHDWYNFSFQRSH
jgi:hypothetical protein